MRHIKTDQLRGELVELKIRGVRRKENEQRRIH